MHQIDYDPDAHAVGLIDQILEVIGATASRGDCEEASDVISEGTVVSMFLAGHKLNHIVTCLFDPW